MTFMIYRKTNRRFGINALPVVEVLAEYAHPVPAQARLDKANAAAELGGGWEFAKSGDLTGMICERATL